MGREINLATRDPDPEAALLRGMLAPDSSLPGHKVEGFRAQQERANKRFHTWRDNFMRLPHMRAMKNPTRGKLPNGLTFAQESLCQNIVAGMPHGQAYREAYKADQLKPAAVYNRLHHAIRHPKVQARLAELWQEREATSAHTPAQLRLFVLERLMLEAIDRQNTGSTRVRAVELIGKLGGVHAFAPEQGEKASEINKDQLIQRLAALLGEADAVKVTRVRADN